MTLLSVWYRRRSVPVMTALCLFLPITLPVAASTPQSTPVFTPQPREVHPGTLNVVRSATVQVPGGDAEDFLCGGQPGNNVARTRPAGDARRRSRGAHRSPAA